VIQMWVRYGYRCTGCGYTKKEQEIGVVELGEVPKPELPKSWKRYGDLVFCERCAPKFNNMLCLTFPKLGDGPYAERSQHESG